MARGRFIGFAPREAMAAAMRARGFELTLAHFPIVSENHLVQWEYVKLGDGIGLMTEAVGDAEPRVRRVIPEAPGIRFPMYLAAHRELHSSRRMRIVFDLLADSLTRPAESPMDESFPGRHNPLAFGA